MFGNIMLSSKSGLFNWICHENLGFHPPPCVFCLINSFYRRCVSCMYIISIISIYPRYLQCIQYIIYIYIYIYVYIYIYSTRSTHSVIRSYTWGLFLSYFLCGISSSHRISHSKNMVVFLLLGHPHRSIPRGPNQQPRM